jgi:ABC-2 type transport system permease protein
MRDLELRSVFDRLNRRVTDERLQRLYPAADTAALRAPMRPREFVMVNGKLAPGNAKMLEGLVFSQTFLIPIVLMMVIIYSSQMIAASIGQEKENKTLETLLTVPIRRTTIVVGKMLGSSLVAIIVAGLFMVAMVYYMGSFTGSMPSAGSIPAGTLASLDIGLTLRSFVFVAIALFLAVVAALALATLLASFADDAKSAQMTTTPLMMIVTLPYLFTILLDVGTASLPVKILVYALPFSYPFLTPRLVAFGNYGLVFAGFAYLAVFAAACIIVAARIFSTDRILTAKLRFRRRSG